jgi:thiamine-monophosphate kinase
LKRRKTELERIALLSARFAGSGAAAVRTGIGDDAAVLEPVAEPLVWTVDAQVEGTHFRLDWLSWRDVGWRSFMAAASDIASMGATPIAALCSLVLAGSVDDRSLDALAEGQADAARVVGAPVVGGNLARGSETSVTTTLLGRARSPVLRAGARVGDLLLLAGSVGMAAAGLALLVQGDGSVQDAHASACVEAWRRPRALLDLGAAMRGSASAAIDVSDGLARDAWHMAEAGSVSLVLDEPALRDTAPEALKAVAARLGRDELDLMLGGGEDYALLVASPSPIEGFVRVGSVEAGPASVRLRRASGATDVLDRSGFDHFA